jgi:unsaturated rhamnogalacturonyl hydrolase
LPVATSRTLVTNGARIWKWGDALYRQIPRTDEGCMQHVTYENAHYQQIWDDTLMMAVLPLAGLGFYAKTLLGEEAKFQFLQHIHYLTDRKSGLWFHGWNFDGRHHLPVPDGLVAIAG